MSIQRLIIVAILSLASVVGAYAARGWEEVDRLPAMSMNRDVAAEGDDSADLYTTVADGYLYVVVKQRTSVKLFTILGQLISGDTFAPGIYRYKLNARGIYLLKAGSQTRRITI